MCHGSHYRSYGQRVSSGRRGLCVPPRSSLLALHGLMVDVIEEASDQLIAEDWLVDYLDHSRERGKSEVRFPPDDGWLLAECYGRENSLKRSSRRGLCSREKTGSSSADAVSVL